MPATARRSDVTALSGGLVFDALGRRPGHRNPTGDSRLRDFRATTVPPAPGRAVGQRVAKYQGSCRLRFAVAEEKLSTAATREHMSMAPPRVCSIRADGQEAGAVYSFI